MKKNRLLIRVLAIVLAVLLVGGAVVSATIGAFAEADAAQAERDRYEIDIVYMEEQQALHVTQRLVYHNRQAFEMDRVLFSAGIHRGPCSNAGIWGASFAPLCAAALQPRAKACPRWISSS